MKSPSRLYIQSKLLLQTGGIRHGVSTATLGNIDYRYDKQSVVAARRKQFSDLVGNQIHHSVGIMCEHSDNWREVGAADHNTASPDLQAAYTLDALITREPGLGLYLGTADCIPLILYAPQKRVLALVHAGWRSTDKKLAQKIATVLIEQYGVSADEMLAFIGPCIGAESYVFEHATQASDPDWQPYVSRTADGLFSIDLCSYNQAQLVSAGLNPQNIEVSDVNTYTDDMFFSHLRSTHTGEPEARFATLVALQS